MSNRNSLFFHHFASIVQICTTKYTHPRPASTPPSLLDAPSTTNTTPLAPCNSASLHHPTSPRPLITYPTNTAPLAPPTPPQTPPQPKTTCDSNKKTRSKKNGFFLFKFEIAIIQLFLL